MMRKLMFLFLLGCIGSVFTSKGKCSPVITKEVLTRLHKTAVTPPKRLVKDIDQPHGRVSFRDESPLSPQDIESLKKNAVTPPKRKVVKADQQTDVIYFEGDE